MKRSHFSQVTRWPGLPAGALALLLCVPAPLLTSCGVEGATGDTDPDQRPAALRVNVDSPELAAGHQVVHRYSGRVETLRTSALGFELDGQIEEVLVDEGAQVGAGATLARLDTARLEAGRRELAASLAEARSQLALAEKTLARVEEAVGYRGASTQRLDEARDARARAEAAAELAAARLASLDVDLDKSTLTAPFAGTVARRLQDEGAVIGAGTPVLVLEETSHLRARVGVAGARAGALEPGMRQMLEGPHGPLQATVTAVLPVRDRVSRTVDVLLDLEPDTAGNRVRAGDLVTLELRLFRERPGYWLPLAALSESERGLWSVLVAKPADDGRSGQEDGDDAPRSQAHAGDDVEYRIERRLVDILYHDGERVFVGAGVKRDDWLVLDGTHRIVVGQRVAPTGPAFLAAHRPPAGGRASDAGHAADTGPATGAGELR